MNKRNTYLLIGLIVVIGIAYFFTSNKNSPSSTNQNNSTTTESHFEVSKINYKNNKYGFVMNLPDTWEGFTTIEDEWQGDSVNQSGQMQTNTQSGPIISIRHPDWEYKSPRQDIPIMVFTLKQWSDMQADKFHIGAAPINPSEIGRNAKYVFAIPARYNFSYLTGFEEVDQIIRGDNFNAF